MTLKNIIMNIPTDVGTIHVGTTHCTPRIINQTLYKVSLPEFLKHLAIAGMGHMPRTYKLVRFLGMSLLYWEFLRDFHNNRFSKPLNGDPNFQRQFSELAGIAIADLLARKIDNVTHTLNFESVTGIRTGRRSDLIALDISNHKAFLIESKGRGSSKKPNICTAKRQASDLINVIKQFSPPITKTKNKTKFKITKGVASISYNLYSKVKAEYYDPEFPEIEIGHEQIKSAIKKYYQGLLDIAQSHIVTKYENTPLKGFDVIEIPLIKVPWNLIIPHNLDKLLGYELEDIQFNSHEGITERFVYYIDRDGIGVCINIERFFGE